MQPGGWGTKCELAAFSGPVTQHDNQNVAPSLKGSLYINHSPVFSNKLVFVAEQFLVSSLHCNLDLCHSPSEGGALLPFFRLMEPSAHSNRVLTLVLNRHECSVDSWFAAS